MKGFAMAVLAVSVAACASAKGPAAALEREPGQPSVSRSMVLKGTFHSILENTGAVRAVDKIRVDGSVTVISTGVSNSSTRVKIEISMPRTNEQLPWAIAPGACGNGAIAITAVSKFGTIDLGSSGRGSVESDFSVSLTPGASYHVEIYAQGQQLADVIACANLKRVE